MKRYLMIVLAGLLVIGMVSPLFAADIKMTGQVRFRYRFWDRISLDKDSNAKERNYFDWRGRWGVDAKLSEGVRAVLQIEKLQNFGAQQPNNANATGTGTNVFFRQAWMDFAIPGLPEGWRLQAGRSFFQVGHGFVYGNSLTGDDGATVYGPLGDGTLKIRFSQPGAASDAGVCCLGSVDAGTGTGPTGGDVYYGLIDYKMEVAEKQNVEIYGIYGIDKGIGSVATGTTKFGGGPITSSSEFWVGGAYSGVAGPLAIKFEGAYQGGTARADAAHPLTGVKTDIDRSAGFAWIDVTYKIIPAWSVSLDASFATGDGNHNDDTHNNFVGPAALFATSPTRVWTDSGFFFGNRTARSIGNVGTNRNYAIWGRGTMDNDSATGFSTADDTASVFSPGLLMMKFKTKYAFNPQTTGFLEVIPAWAAKSPTTGTGVGTDITSYLGTEIDLKVSYKPYKNVLVNGYFGYFIPGGFYDQGGALAAATITGGSAPAKDDAYVFRGEIYTTF